MKKMYKSAQALILAAALICTIGFGAAADGINGMQASDTFVIVTSGSYDAYIEETADYQSTSATVTIGAENLLPESNVTIATGEIYGENNCVQFAAGGAKATFAFNVPESGVYQLAFDYASLPGTAMDISIAIRIDGVLLWDELADIKLMRWWKNASEEWPVDRDGNQVTSEQIESYGFRRQYACDEIGVDTERYAFALTAGEHTVEIESRQEPFAIKNILFVGKTELKTYREAAKEYQTVSDYAGEDLIIQGENAYEKNSSSLTALSDTLSSAVNPQDPYHNQINYIGSSNWSAYGQTIKWQIEVPEDGLYEMGFHYKQAAVVNGSVYRAMKIDGESPFAEADNIEFAYSSGWEYTYLSDESGAPCKVYLEKGTHTLELSVALGPMAEYYKRLKRVVEIIGDDYLKITMITGETPDVNRDYDLFVQIPNLEKDFSECISSLDTLAADMSVMSEKSSSQYVATIKGIKRILSQMTETKYLAHTYKSDLYTQYCNVSSLLYEMLSMPLSLDEIRLSSPADAEPEYPGGWSQLKFSFLRFLSSFVKDYASIEKDSDSVTLRMWTTWGRDQTQVLNSLISESFTPSTGINVDVRITGATLIQGIMTNTAPDMSLGVLRANPVNYALRGAVYDLSKFKDFEEVLTRFNEGAEEPYRYNGGCYALPDTQTFNIMFYRTDILNNLDLKVPDTWDEFIEVTSVIQRNNMNVYLPEPGGVGIYGSLLMQNGTDIYNAERNRNLLDSDAAIDVFTAYTDYYTKYKVPVTADFYNRFRIGVTPLGIAPYTTYTTFSELAPDIEGRWAIALIPGIKQADGTIDRTTAGGGTGCVILNNSEHKEEAWEFLKWWTSADTQYRFSKNVESLLGKTGRIATATKESLSNYSWDAADLKVLLAQWNYVREVPEVPGSYYLTRSIEQAFYGVVNSGETPSDAMNRWSKIANEEITRKINEYA